MGKHSYLVREESEAEEEEEEKEQGRKRKKNCDQMNESGN